MKSRTKRIGARPWAILALTCALLLGSVRNAKAESEDSPMGLGGTWRVTVTLKNCQTGAPLGNPFHSLLIFAHGGTMSGATSNPAFLAGQRSGDAGVWSRTKGRKYSAVSEAFVLFSGGPFSAGVQTITHDITLMDGGNGFADAALVQFHDVNGTPVAPPPSCGAAVGQRLQ